MLSNICAVAWRGGTVRSGDDDYDDGGDDDDDKKKRTHSF